MEPCPNTKIYNLIRTTGFIKHKSRQEFLVYLINGVIKSQSVVFSEIADKIDKDIKTKSIERRSQDFFQKVSFDYTALGIFLLSFIHHDASIRKMAVPLYFEMLENNSVTAIGKTE